VSRTARIDSNRRNAQRSTGPKSVAGKSKVAKNALRHGLAVPARLDSLLSDEIEGLARLIAGDEAPLYLLDCARKVAEAQIDLRRIRQVRVSTWASIANSEPNDASAERSKSGPLVGLLGEETEMDFLVKRLVRLDRYERRALSRRRAAVRELEFITLSVCLFSRFGKTKPIAPYSPEF
jgi:hypothetical protein